jgi:hypothetical protein
MASIWAEENEEPELGLDLSKATPLDLLLAVVRNATLPLSTRMRAANIAAPFVHPKLAVVANVPYGDIKERLEKAILRSNAVRLVASPTNLQPGAIIDAQPQPSSAKPEEQPGEFKRRF